MGLEWAHCWLPRPLVGTSANGKIAPSMAAAHAELEAWLAAFEGTETAEDLESSAA